MIVSTRGRYALRVMLDLAEIGNDKYTAMKTIADRQGISLKYLERILPVLTKSNLIEGIQGKGGGYRLSRVPADYKVSEILLLTEGDLAPVPCLEDPDSPCENACKCKTLSMWKGLHKLIIEYFDGITLKDLLKGNINI